MDTVQRLHQWRRRFFLKLLSVCFSPAFLSMSEQIHCIPKLHHNTQQNHNKDNNNNKTSVAHVPLLQFQKMSQLNILASKLLVSVHGLYSSCTNAVSFYTVAKI